MQNNRRKIFKIVLMAIFVAIVIVQTFVPFLGFIPIPGLPIVIIHITVIVAGVVFGPVEGAVLGAVWGLLTMYRAAFAPVNPILDPVIFINPLISLLPRILVGLLPALLIRALLKTKINPLISYGICGAAGAMTNTILVLSLMKIIYGNFLAGLMDNVMKALLAAVTTNGVPELIAAAILVPAIAQPLSKVYRKSLQ